MCSAAGAGSPPSICLSRLLLFDSSAALLSLFVASSSLAARTSFGDACFPGWLFGAWLKASASMSSTTSPSASHVARARQLPLSCGLLRRGATNHCMNTACPSSDSTMRASMLLLRVRIIPSISLLLCWAATLHLLSPSGDCCAIALTSRAWDRFLFVLHMLFQCCVLGSPSLFMMILPYPSSCSHSKMTLQILPSPVPLTFTCRARPSTFRAYFERPLQEAAVQAGHRHCVFTAFSFPVFVVTTPASPTHTDHSACAPCPVSPWCSRSVTCSAFCGPKRPYLA